MTFTVPVKGIYIMGIVVTANGFISGNTKISVYYITELNKLLSIQFSNSRNINNWAVLNANCLTLLKLNKSDKVTVHVSGDLIYQIAISMFLYKPIHTKHIAWSIFCRLPRIFFTSTIDDAKVWNYEKQTLSIPESGLYYIGINSDIFNKNNNIFVILNGKTILLSIGTRKSRINVQNGLSTISKSQLVNLNKKNTLRIDYDNLSTSFSGTTMFIGFLMFPT
jgi:hypothetical protein